MPRTAISNINNASAALKSTITHTGTARNINQHSDLLHSNHHTRIFHLYHHDPHPPPTQNLIMSSLPLPHPNMILTHLAPRPVPNTCAAVTLHSTQNPWIVMTVE